MMFWILLYDIIFSDEIILRLKWYVIDQHVQMEVLSRLEHLHNRLKFMKIIGHDIGMWVLNLLDEKLIIGQVKNIMIIYGDDHEMLRYLGDEQKIEIIDNDHVLMDIMCQVFENGLPWFNGLQREFPKKQLMDDEIVIDYIIFRVEQLVKSFKMLFYYLEQVIVIIIVRHFLAVNEQRLNIGHLLRMVHQLLLIHVILV